MQITKSLAAGFIVILLFACICHGNTVTVSKADNKPGNYSAAATDSSVAKKKQKKATKPKYKDPVVPDTTINGKLHIFDYYSSERFYPDIKKVKVIEFLRQDPIAIFQSKNKNQYLLAYQPHGGTKYQFGNFEICYTSDLEKKIAKRANVTAEDSFRTESGLALGISLDSVIAIKGINYKKKQSGNKTTILYRIDDMERSLFLKRYELPGYFIEITLRDDKVTRIYFGFEEP